MGRLEGPKKHHDNHGMDASVPHKGKGAAVPSEHWEHRYSMTKSSPNMVATCGSDFNPKCPDERKTTHLKVNSTDH